MAIEKYYQPKDSDSMWKDLDNMIYQLHNVIDNECIDIVENIIDELYEEGSYDDEETMKEDATYDRNAFEEKLHEIIDEHQYCIYYWYSRMLVAIESDIAEEVANEYGEEVDLDNLGNIAYWILYKKCFDIAEENFDLN